MISVSSTAFGTGPEVLSRLSFFLLGLDPRGSLNSRKRGIRFKGKVLSNWRLRHGAVISTKGGRVTRSPLQFKGKNYSMAVKYSNT